MSDTGRRYEALFRELGAAQARSLPIHDREDAERPELLEILDDSDGSSSPAGTSSASAP